MRLAAEVLLCRSHKPGWSSVGSGRLGRARIGFLDHQKGWEFSGEKIKKDSHTSELAPGVTSALRSGAQQHGGLGGGLNLETLGRWEGARSS